MPEETKQYLLKRADGSQFVVSVPASWKVTFGAIVPTTFASSGHPSSWGVRFHETKDKQRAVFAGIVEMRDLSIPLIEDVKDLRQAVLEAIAMEERFTKEGDDD